MKSPYTIYTDFILARYDKKRFITYKKAQFVATLALLLFSLLLGLTIFAATSGPETLLRIGKTTTPVMLTVFVLLVLIRMKKSNVAADILAIVSAVVVVAGYFSREPRLVGVTLAYFMYVDVVFSVMFCSRVVAWLVYVSFMATHVVYFFLVARPVAQGDLLEIVTLSMVEGTLTMTLVFITALFTSSFLRQALLKTKDESSRSREQFDRIRNLMTAIQSTSNKLTDSVKITSGVINTFSDNAQSQAASMEELSATMEEISAGSDSVSGATENQATAMDELVQVIDDLSGSIDRLENNGQNISTQMMSFLQLAQEGEKASAQLEETNQKIWENSSNIQQVVTMIENFFEKINMLALNASIEAARAGEHGRGFAVVAEEIGKLADTSSQQLKQITEFINQNNSDVNEANRIITTIIEFISNLLERTEDIRAASAAVIKEIDSEKELKDTMNSKTAIVQEHSHKIRISMGEQKNAIQDIMKSIDNTNKIVQDNAMGTEHLRDNAMDVKSLASDLEGMFETDYLEEPDETEGELE